MPKCRQIFPGFLAVLLSLVWNTFSYGQSDRISELQKSLKSASLADSTRGFILHELGREYISEGKLGKASENFDQALNLLKYDKKSYLSYLEWAGYFFSDEGYLILGIEYLEDALWYAQVEGLKAREVRILCNIGNIFVDYDQDSLALDYINRSRQMARKYNDSDFYKYLDYSMGGLLVHMKKPKPDSAMYYTKRSFREYSLKKDTLRIINTYNTFSLIYKAKKQLDSAEFWIRKSIENELKYPGYADLGISYFNLGRILIDKKAFKEAIVQLKKSLVEIAEEGKGNTKINEARTNFALGDAYAGIGEFKRANEYFKEYDRLSTEYENEIVSDRIAQWAVSKRRSRLERERDLHKFQLEKEKQKNVIIIIVSVVLVLFGAFWIYFNEQKKRTLKDLAERNQQIADQKINELLKRQEIHSLQGVLAGQETERKRIAEDLHDKLGAILSMVKLHFSAVEDRLDDLRDENKEQYNKANDLLDQATVEVRNISHNLISGVLTKFGLVPALKDLKETIESTGKLNIQLVVNDLTERLGGEQELQIYRVIQELVGNILKHAQATEAVIQLNKTEGHFNLMVEDNGVGFDIEASRSKEGIGLKNLEARVNKLRGTIHFDSGKGAGTTVSIDIPLDND